MDRRRRPFLVRGEHWRCRLDSYACERAESTPPGNPLEVPSPDKKVAVSRRGHDLWARSPSDGREWALTTDGEPDHQYGSGPDSTSNGTLLRKFGLPHLPPAVAWSPDSTKVLAHRTDERGVRQTHLVEARPADGGAPLLRTQRYAYPGDENMPQAQLVVLDVAEGTVVRAQAEPLLMPQLSPIMIKWAWWAPHGSAVYYLSQPRDLRTLTLHRLEPATGEVTTVLSETGPPVWSTPPVSRVRDWAGRVLAELERADISKLTATGWTPPERFHVMAADGVTDIYGVLYRPRGFDPEQRYPVVDSVYPGPQVDRVTPSFDPGGMGLDAEPIAALGFVVVAVDGRGTPGRSKSFHDTSYGHLADAGCLADHVAALRQLAQARPWMDLDRVGAFGHSGGGFAAARAMLDFPEVYKAGVAGNHDDRYFNLGFVEAYDGADNPEAWARASNVDIADRLTGKLLLIHGEMDDQVHPDHTLRLADRLIAADKDFELLIVPGAEHTFIDCLAYVRKRCWDFLVRELMGTQPPAYRPAPIAIDPELLGELFA